MSGHTRVGDDVRTVPDDITGTVSAVGQKLVRTAADGEITLVLRVVATVRVTVASYYGEFMDIPIDQLRVIRKGETA